MLSLLYEGLQVFCSSQNSAYDLGRSQIKIKEKECVLMRGKNKCKALKEIRKKIAENNDIEYIVSECTYQGECKGTCPKCEEELRYLESELAKRQKLGKTLAIAGISIGICGGLAAGCDKVSEYIEELIGIDECTGALPAISMDDAIYEGRKDINI